MATPPRLLHEDPLLYRAPVSEGFKVLEPAVLYARIGHGGMGTVYRGRHLNLDCDVAVKILRQDLAQDEHYVARFEREARLAARIKNDNVVQVMDVRSKNGIHYLVMEFVRGETARERVVRKGPLPEAQALAIVSGCARGLRAAHAEHIVHRDIKPENILIASDGAVKLADLGLAKLGRDERDRTLPMMTTGIMGTPAFMPPEQWRSTTVEPTADIWALGATLWFLLAGRSGIEDGELLDIADQIRDRDFPDLAPVRPDVRPEIHAIVAKCTRRDPKERFQDARELLRALQAVANFDEDVLADAATGTIHARSTVVTPPPRSTMAKIRRDIVQEPHATEALHGPMRTPPEARSMPPEEIAPRRRAWALAALLVIAGAGASAYAAFGTNRQESPTRAPDAPPSATATPTPDAEIATLLTKARALQADDPAGAYDIVTKVRDRFPGDADAKALVAEIEPMLRKAALAAVRVTTPGTSAISNRRTIELSGSVDSADRIRTLRAALVPGRSAAGPLPTNAVDVPVSSARTFATTLTAPSDGEWSLRVQASDGRIAADLEPRIVRVDATPPTVTLREPASDRLLANITAVVDVEDAGQVTAVTVNGVTAERDGAGRWSCSLSLDANVRELVVVARDDAANETRFVKRVRVVTDPPAVHVTKDLPRFTREREVVLEGRVDDPTTTSVSWAGAPITVAADGRFRATATFRAEGEQTFHLVAKDVAGPEASREVIACYDITSPVLTWTSPTADSVAVGQVLLTGTVRDDHAVTVRVNGADATVRDGTWTASVEVTDAGLDVVVSASDEAGNVTTLATRRLSARALAAEITWGTREPDATDVLVDGRLHPSVVRVRGTSIRMHLVPGCPDGFTMGSPLTEPDREEDEQQQQRIVRPFWIAETEVTNEQWKAVTGNDASGATMPQHPVVGVTFRECLDFLARLSERAGTAERPLRLPNEAEWEYACRAGSAAPFSIDPARICAKAEAPVAAGSTPANAFGLHEMHGNVWEWCADPFSSDRETSGAASPSSQARVVRGGSWRTERSRCRSANRNLNWSYDRANDLGFRIARDL